MSMEQEFILPVGVRNYQSRSGWNQALITESEEWLIQNAVRQRNFRILVESVEDAKAVLANCGVPEICRPNRISRLAMFLAERRIVHVSHLYDEYLRAKIEAERQKHDQLNFE